MYDIGYYSHETNGMDHALTGRYNIAFSYNQSLRADQGYHITKNPPDSPVPTCSQPPQQSFVIGTLVMRSTVHVIRRESDFDILLVIVLVWSVWM